MNPFSHLNPSQQEAVLATEGRVLVLAGAGSGKTSVLTYRIAYLLSLGVDPSQILGLTFTNKAAAEMRERVARLVDRSASRQVTLSTFHSFCMQILRKEIHHLGYTKQFSLYDERDVHRLTSGLVKTMLEHEGPLPSIETTLDKLSLAKAHGGLSSKETWHDQFTTELQTRLQSCMRAYNAVDFDSLLSLTVQLFEEFPHLLEQYQERFSYIMVDEYQDTSPMQYRLVALLSKRSNNLCVVGDDDQSIYGWRGAKVEHILEFEADKTIRLEQNYRSTPTILRAANSVIANNLERHSKELWSSTKVHEPIILFHAPTEEDEAQSVVQRMVYLHQEKQIPWKEMAILYRSNLLSRNFELALMQTAWKKGDQWVRGIPYEIFGGTEFSARAEIKDVMAYLRAIDNPSDAEALLRIINVPRRGISDRTLDQLTQINRRSHLPLWHVLKEVASPLSSPLKQDFSDRVLHSIRSFVTLMETAQQKFRQRPLHSALSWLLDEVDYFRSIAEEVKSERMREFRQENVTYCVDALAIYEEESGEDASLAEFLSTSLLDQERLSSHRKEQREDKVNVMTFHSAKGLEFTACFLVGLEDHIIPHEKSLLTTGLEEERRLMYVAITRAKRHLTLSMARKRKKMGKEIATNPSRFLFEIPKDLLLVTPWQLTHS